MRSRGWWLRVVAPPAAVGAVIAGVSVGLPASAAPSLPTKTPQQVLAMVARADVAGISGNVVEKASLGLPSIPSTADTTGPTGLTGLLTGTHSLRVWDGGPRQLRVQVLDQLDETEVVVNGTDVWTYTYSTNSATHLSLPPQQSSASHAATPNASSLTPEQLATQAIAAIDPTTQVSVSGTASVAGRDAYTLTVAPRTDNTTVGKIAVDVDASTGVPLRVRIFAKGSTSAALSVGFSSVSFAAIPASRFDFSPPPDARVSTGQVPALPSGPHRSSAPTPSGDRPYTVGSGWSSVLVLPTNPLTAAQEGGGRDSQARAFASAIAKAGQPVKGGTLVSTALVNVLLTDDGRMLVGAVPAATLQAAATAPAPTR